MTEIKVALLAEALVFAAIFAAVILNVNAIADAVTIIQEFVK